MSEITTSKTFQERMFERVRDQMGDLLTDEDLKRIVEVAVEKAFFQDRADGSYSRKPSEFVEYVRKELQNRMFKAVDDWLKANPEKVQESIEKVIQEGVLKACMGALENRMNGPFYQFAEQLRNQGVFR